MSLRVKLIIVLSIFVLTLVGVSAIMFLRERSIEVAQTTFRSMAAFSELTSEQVARDYETFYLQQNSVFFQRSLQKLFVRNPAIQSVSLYAYDGKLLYDSRGGQASSAPDEQFISQIQSKFSSVLTENGSVFFLKKTTEGDFQFFNQEEKNIDAPGDTERSRLFVTPVLDRYGVVYTVNYATFDEDIARLRTRIFLLAFFGVLLGFGFAWFFGSRISQPVQALVVSSSIIAKGDLSHRVDLKTGDEFEVLGKAFNAMVEGVERSLKDSLSRERVEKELELAREMQNRVLPKESPQLNDFDLAGGLIAAPEVGGDFYDFVDIGSNRLLMYVGDVSDHGVPSAMTSVLASTLISAFGSKNLPLVLLAEINKILKKKIPANMFLTLGLLVWDGNTKAFEFINAGHQPLLQFHAGDSKVTSTGATGVGLCMVPDVSQQLKSEPLTLQSGDVFLIYSDGIPEAFKNEKENYGIARLKRAFMEYATLPSALAIRNALLSDVKEFMGSYRQLDDMTLIVVKRRNL